MLICRGDGELLVNPDNGNVVWGEVGSSILTWYRQNGFLNALEIEDALKINIPELPLPECNKCPEYKNCCDCLDLEDDEPDNTHCIAIDDKTAGELILEALSNLDDDERNDILGYHCWDE